MLGQAMKLVLDPGAATSGLVRRLGLLVALVALGCCVGFTAFVFAGLGVYQIAAMWLLPPWPALVTAGLALTIAGTLLHRARAPADAATAEAPADVTAPMAKVVRDHPWESVLAAVAAGVVVSQSRELGSLLTSQLLDFGKHLQRADKN